MLTCVLMLGAVCVNICIFECIGSHHKASSYKRAEFSTGEIIDRGCSDHNQYGIALPVCETQRSLQHPSVHVHSDQISDTGFSS